MDYRKKPEPSEVIDRLKKLKSEFNEKSDDYRRMADTVSDALSLLEDTEKQKQAREAARFRDRVARQTAAVKTHLDKAKQEGKQAASFTVFVDHTGSMTQKPFYAALDAAGVLQNAAGAAVALWGSSDDVRWVKEDILAPAVREGFVKKGASSDFRPVADEMIKTAALDKVEGRRSHFVVISDGEFADYPKAKAQLEKLLKSARSATVDFVIMGRAGTGMEFLAEQLAKDFPARVKHHVANGPAYWQGTEADLSKEVQEKVAGVVKARLHQTRKPKPKAAAQPAAS